MNTNDQPTACRHDPRSIATCGTCHNAWCADCDPSPADQCHTCVGRGYSIAPRRTTQPIPPTPDAWHEYDEMAADAPLEPSDLGELIADLLQNAADPRLTSVRLAGDNDRLVITTTDRTYTIRID